MKKRLLTVIVVGIWIASFSLPTHAGQIAPNPNYGTIETNYSSNFDIFENFGTLNNPYMLDNYGTLNNNSGGTLNLGIGFIEFLNAFVYTSNGSLLNRGTLNNNSGGTLNIYDANLNNYSGSTLNNSGTLNNYYFGKLTNHPNSTLNNSGLLNNYSTLKNEDGGILNNSGTLNNSGNYLEGKVSWLDNEYNSTLNNSGTLYNSSGNYLLNDGTLNNYSSLNNEGKVYNGPVAKLNNYGTLSNNSDFANDGTLNNYSSGTLINNATLNSTLMNNYGIVNNYSILNTTVWMNNSGTLNNSSTLNSSGSFRNFGLIDNFSSATLVFDLHSSAINAGGIVNNSGTLINDGMLYNIGTLNNNSGLFNNSGMFSNLGEMNNYVTMNNNGTLTNISGGYSDGTISIYSTGVLNNFGILNNNSGGTLYIYYPTTVTNSGILNNSGTLNNNGTISGSGGKYQQTAGSTINNGYLSQTDIHILGGSLSGTGTITGDVSIGSEATVRPGDPSGIILTINGDFTSSGNLMFEISGKNYGQYNQLKINSGEVLFTGGSMDFDFTNGYQAEAGDRWDLLYAISIDGLDMLTYTLNGLDSGLGWEFKYINGIGSLVITPSAVPAPGAAWLLGSGLVGLAGFRRKKRQQPDPQLNSF